jgi:hypothetical protein
MSSSQQTQNKSISPKIQHCHFNTFKPLQKYGCRIRTAIWKPFSVDYIKFEGKHKSDKNDQLVYGFEVDNQQSAIYFLPIKIHLSFANLEGISVIESNVTEIFKSNFEKLHELQFIDLRCNKIQGIKAGTFEDNQKLRVIHLSENKIAQIDRMAFEGLKNLAVIDLSENPCQLTNANDKSAVIAQIKNGVCFVPLLVNALKTLDNLKSTHTTNAKTINDLNYTNDALTTCLFAAISIALAAIIFVIISGVFFIKTFKNDEDKQTLVIDNEQNVDGSYQQDFLSPQPSWDNHLYDNDSFVMSEINQPAELTFDDDHFQGFDEVDIGDNNEIFEKTKDSGEEQADDEECAYENETLRGSDGNEEEECAVGIAVDECANENLEAKCSVENVVHGCEDENLAGCAVEIGEEKCAIEIAVDGCSDRNETRKNVLKQRKSVNTKWFVEEMREKLTEKGIRVVSKDP